MITTEMWISALLGAVVAAVFSACLALFGWIFLRIRNSTGLRCLLGPFAENIEPCAVFTRWLRSPDNTFLFDAPDYFPPHTTGKGGSVGPIPHVVAKASMEAATDALHVLGQVSKNVNIDFKSAHRHWDDWSSHIITIGGHGKSRAIISASDDGLVEIVEHNQLEALRLCGDNHYFQALNQSDYGLIYKTKYPSTDRTCFVFMGLGCLGTEAAAYYFRTNATALGRLFGRKSFALIMECRIDEGKQSARACSCSPRPSWLRRNLLFSTRSVMRDLKRPSNQSV